MKQIIKFQNLTYLTYINALSTTIKEGEMTVISSSGKKASSFLLSLASGLIQPDDGGIYVSNKKICFSSLNIGYFFNSNHIKECCEGINNIPEDFRLLRNNNAEINYFLINHYLQTFGLVNYKSPSNRTSTGIALKLFKSLVTTPELLLIDESLLLADSIFTRKFHEMLYHVVRQDKKMCLIASSSPKALQNITDKTIHL